MARFPQAAEARWLADEHVRKERGKHQRCRDDERQPVRDPARRAGGIFSRPSGKRQSDATPASKAIAKAAARPELRQVRDRRQQNVGARELILHRDKRRL